MTRDNNILPDEEEQYEKLFRARWNYELRNGMSRSLANERRIEEYCSRFDKRRAGQLLWLNPWAGEKWTRHILAALKAEVRLHDCRYVTLISAKHDIAVVGSGTGPRQMAADMFATIEEFKLFVRQKLRGMDYLLFVDLAYHRLAKLNVERLCVHAHGLIWATAGELDRVAERFQPGFSEAPGLIHSEPKSLRKIVNYGVKDTRLGYSKFPKRIGGDLIPWSGAYKLTWKHLAAFMIEASELDKPSMTIAGGCGRSVRAEAVRLAREEGYQGLSIATFSPSEDGHRGRW